MPVICSKYLLHRSAKYNGAELWRIYRSTLYQEMKDIILYEIKDILLYEGNILNISMLFLILLKMLCIYYVQTYTSMYTIMFSW